MSVASTLWHYYRAKKGPATTEWLEDDYHNPAKPPLSSIQTDGLDEGTPPLPNMSLIAESSTAHIYL